MDDEQRGPICEILEVIPSTTVYIYMLPRLINIQKTIIECNIKRILKQFKYWDGKIYKTHFITIQVLGWETTFLQNNL